MFFEWGSTFGPFLVCRTKWLWIPQTQAVISVMLAGRLPCFLLSESTMQHEQKEPVGLCVPFLVRYLFFFFSFLTFFNWGGTLLPKKHWTVFIVVIQRRERFVSVTLTFFYLQLATLLYSVSGNFIFPWMILDQPVRIFIFLYSYIFSFIWIHLIYMSKVAFVASDLKQNNDLYLRQVWFGDQLSHNYAFPRHYFSEIYPQLQLVFWALLPSKLWCVSSI